MRPELPTEHLPKRMLFEKGGCIKIPLVQKKDINRIVGNLMD